MARASADITSKAREAWLLRMRAPTDEPRRFTKEQPKKAPGSKKLVLGEWVTVQPDDDDASKPRRKGPRPVGSGGVGEPRDGAL
jgi:hypothetical protein